MRSMRGGMVPSAQLSEVLHEALQRQSETEERERDMQEQEGSLSRHGRPLPVVRVSAEDVARVKAAIENAGSKGKAKRALRQFRATTSFDFIALVAVVVLGMSPFEASRFARSEWGHEVRRRAAS